MTLFEQQFIKKCLEILSQILSNEERLNAAIDGFTLKDRDNPRYQLNTKISDAVHWTHSELLNFSAAYSETLFQVMNSYSHHKTVPIEQLNSALELLEKEFISQITRNTKPHLRIQSVVENMSQIEINAFEIEDKAKESTANPFSFFFTPQSVGLIATATLAAAAIYLTQGNSNS